MKYERALLLFCALRLYIVPPSYRTLLDIWKVASKYMTWIITNLKRNVNVKTSWSCYYIVSCPTRLSKIQRSEIYSKYSKFLNFSRHNFPSIYKLNFYCWTVVSLIRLSAPPFLLFQMRNVAANFKVLDIGSDNFDQVCVFYIVLTLYQISPMLLH